jgi:hypothetical protein
MTDSLDMRAVTDKIEAPKAGLLAFEAGCDILLYTDYTDRSTRSFRALLDSILMDRVDSGRLVESSQRRAKLLKRLDELGRRLSTDEDAYQLLMQKVRTKAIEIKEGAEALPIPSDEVSVLSTSGSVLERLRGYVGTLNDTADVSAVTDKVLIIWISEPLVVNRAFRNINPMIENAKLSILATTYSSLPQMMPKCDVTILYHDTSSHTEETIMEKLFGK